MIRRWVALGIAEAQKGFQRVKGNAHLPSLVAALRPPPRPWRPRRRSPKTNEAPPLPEVQQGTWRSLELRPRRVGGRSDAQLVL
jgi:hypothetical protein